jgi:hypothetical protein
MYGFGKSCFDVGGKVISVQELETYSGDLHMWTIILPMSYYLIIYLVFVEYKKACSRCPEVN